MRRIFLCFMALSLSLTLWGAEAGACSTSDIEIRQADYHKELDWYRIVGEIVNRCPTAVKVELQAVLRDASDHVVIVHKFWPAGVRTIEAYHSYPFSALERDIGHPVTKLEVNVIGADGDK